MQVYQGTKIINFGDGQPVDLTGLVPIAGGSPATPKIWIGTVAQLAQVNPRDAHTVYITTDGATGANQWNTGIGVPDNGIGENGDLYLQNDGNVYIKQDGIYVLQTNIKGEKGDKGDAGNDGANGADGLNGQNGQNGNDGINGAGVLSNYSLNMAVSGGVNAFSATPATALVQFQKYSNFVTFDGIITAPDWVNSFQGWKAGSVKLAGLTDIPSRVIPFFSGCIGSIGANIRFNSFASPVGSLFVQVYHKDFSPTGLGDSSKNITFAGHYLI